MEKQTCPSCNIKVNPSPRYPDYICENCVNKAQSEDGRPVKFYNEDAGGGCIGEYADTKATYEGNIVYVNGIKCEAQEAHFGGIVIKPVK
jgi:hypothetical protein